jgi:nitroimidazol reductase NimA-like FMN-containing flavoprotein (pyridoxamine 5'-phosphate oxidase superfamily)
VEVVPSRLTVNACGRANGRRLVGVWSAASCAEADGALEGLPALARMTIAPVSGSRRSFTVGWRMPKEPMMPADATSSSISRTLVAEECTSLLRSGGVGRVAVVVSGRPHIVPVNYVADGDVVVFRTEAGTILNDVSRRAVAFETDAIDLRTRSGWSVCVHGEGYDITDAIDPESRRLRELPLDCWAPGERDHWYKVVPQEVTGRRLYSGRSAGLEG